MGLTDYTISDKKYFQAGVEYERERILKWVEATTDWDDFGEFIVYKDELISLIKGEQPHPPQQFRDRSNGE
jgi:hypothetical protein